jgi:Chain length determinant protein
MRQIEPPHRDLGFDVPALIPQVSHAPSHTAMAAGKREYSGTLEYWNMIRRHPAAVVMAALTGGLIGFLMTLSQPRVYQAHATIEIQSLNDNFLNMKELNPTVEENSSSGSDSDIQTQVKILLSNTLIRRVTARMVEPRYRKRFRSRTGFPPGGMRSGSRRRPGKNCGAGRWVPRRAASKYVPPASPGSWT